MTVRRHRGFSLIELMIGLAIAGMLLVLAAPNYAAWVADGQIRSAAESIAGGMRIAYGEAIKRNAKVEFVLNSTTGSGGWRVRTQAGSTVIRTEVFGEGSKLAQFATTPGSATTVTFTPLGLICDPTVDVTCAAPVLTQVDVTFSGATVNTRPLRVLVGGGRSGIKLCDPNPLIPDTDPRFCTAAY